jgi:hypothetical protein
MMSRAAPAGTALSGPVGLAGGPPDSDDGLGSERALGANGHRSLLEATAPRFEKRLLQSESLASVRMQAGWLVRFAGAAATRSGDSS